VDESDSSLLNDPLVAASEAGEWKRVESLWLERLEGERIEPAPLLQAAGHLQSPKERDRLKVLASMTAPLLLEAGQLDAVDRLARIVAGAKVDDPEIVEAVLAAARRRRTDHSLADALVTRADLERARGLSHVIELLDAFLRFDVNDLAHHTGGWGTGEIQKIIVRREEIHVRFESGRSHIFPMRTAGEYLKRIPPDSIDALVRRDPERLKREASSDPLNLVARAGAKFGGAVDGKELKEILVPAVIEDGAWSGWWNGVRDRLRKDPYYDISSGPNPKITKRKEPRTYSADTLGRLEQAKTFWEKLSVLRKYARSVKRREADPDFVKRSFGELAGSASGPAEETCLVFVGEELHLLVPALPVPEFPPFTGPGSLEDRIRNVPMPEYKHRLLDEARRRFPEEWPAAFERLLGGDDPDVLDPAVEALLKEGHAGLVEGRFPALLSDTKKRPWAFLWFFRNAVKGRFEGLKAVPGPTDLVDMLLDVYHGAVTERIAEGEEAKKIVFKGRAALNEEALKRAFEGVSHAGAKRLWTRIRTEGLTRMLVQRAEKIVAKRFPDIIATEESYAGKADEEDVIWSTASGLKKRRREYDHLMDVEFPKNAEALGNAIAMGDLSENAEYDAAREEQSRLTERAKRMEEELQIARVIEAPGIQEDKVRIGSVAEVEEESGKQLTYAILGPWDTDFERGIISYLSPIGQALIGKQVGDEVRVRLPDGEAKLRVKSTATAPQVKGDPDPTSGS